MGYTGTPQMEIVTNIECQKATFKANTLAITHATGINMQYACLGCINRIWCEQGSSILSLNNFSCLAPSSYDPEGAIEYLNPGKDNKNI